MRRSAAGRKSIPANSPAASLARLVERLDAACAGAADAMNEAVSQALQAACAEPGLLSREHCRGRPERYQRHLLHADPAGRYTLVALVWEPGQFSPVHGHYTWCGYAVVSGRLREERYCWTGPRQAAELLGGDDRTAGERCFSHAGLDEIHRLGNRERTTAVSIHVYGVDAPRVATHVNRVVPLAEARQP